MNPTVIPPDSSSMGTRKVSGITPVDDSATDSEIVPEAIHVSCTLTPAVLLNKKSKGDVKLVHNR